MNYYCICTVICSKTSDVNKANFCFFVYIKTKYEISYHRPTNNKPRKTVNISFSMKKYIK